MGLNRDVDLILGWQGGRVHAGRDVWSTHTHTPGGFFGELFGVRCDLEPAAEDVLAWFINHASPRSLIIASFVLVYHAKTRTETSFCAWLGNVC